MNLGFLLGAGFSVPAGYPTVDEIDNAFLNNTYENRTLSLFTNLRITSYPFDQLLNVFTPYHQSILIDVWNSFNVRNYEELFQLLVDLHRNDKTIQSKDFGIFTSIAQKHYSEFNEKLFITELNRDPDHLIYFFRIYVIEIIYHCLSNRLTSTTVFTNLILKLLLSSIENTLHVITINHDTSLEQALVSNDVPYSDGFDTANCFKDVWPPNALHLYKLHGSIDWYSNSCLMKTTNLLRIPEENSHKLIDSIIAVGIETKFHFYSLEFMSTILNKVRQNIDEINV
ncbi:MAG: SIR2 family protein [Candidatus Cloacimonetes bacterium]|nr:SIR2 family protein [Candidatus Cloacimonadota bacterium]